MTTVNSFSFEIASPLFKLILHAGNETYIFGFREMVRLQKQLNNVDVDSMLLPNHREYEILYLAYIDRYLLLSLSEIIELKKLLITVHRQLLEESQLCRLVQSIQFV